MKESRIIGGLFERLARLIDLLIIFTILGSIPSVQAANSPVDHSDLKFVFNTTIIRFVEPLQLVAPDYNCQTGAITFRTTGGDGSPIEYMAIGVKGWSTNPNGVIEAEKRADLNSGTTVNLLARQKGVTISYEFDYSAYCNKNYKPFQLVAPDYNCQTGAITFRTTGGDGSPIEYMAIGVKGWSTNPNGVIEAEKRADLNSGRTVNLLARQKGITVSYEFNFGAYCNGLSSSLQLVAPDYNCQTGAITFRTTGGDGSPIEYMAIGVKGWSTNPNGVIEAEKRADLNSGTTVNLLARQKGVVISYEFNFGTYCNGTTPSEELKIVDPKYDCSSSELTLLYSGGDGSPVEFFVEELTDWTSNSIHVIDIGFPQGKNFIIKARQKGLEISKSFYIAGCPYESSGIITLSGVEEKKFNPLNSKVTLTLNNALFSPNVEDFFIQVNDQQISPVSVNSNKVELELNLKDGLNTLSYYLKDSNGLLLEGHHQIWAGSKNMPVQVVNKANELISNAKVKISLSDDKNVIAEGTTVNGVVTFQNLPVRTIIATALTIDNLFGSAATVADGNLLTISLLSFDIPSTIDNNDISLGTQGWNIGNSPVKVILHEGSTASGFNAAAENQDLQLSTSGEGPRSMSRTFVSKPGTKTITIRYRFITSEIPGGYFGTQYNDYFSVSIRSKNSGTIASEQNSMNGLGYGAFNPTTGETAWREKTLSVGSEGEEIQVDVVVANVADDLLDSQVEVDFIDEKRLDISDIALLDPDQKNSLKYLSIDQHPYFGGKVPIYGTIKIKGPKEDRLNSLNLEVLQGGKVIATADLVSSAQSKLFEPFGSDEQVEINIKELLFEIPSTDPLDADGIVQLRINAKTENGQDATKDYDQSLPNMRLFKGTRDGSDRDEDEGGDGWGLPSVIQYADGLPAGWGVNDISNMCGNDTPDHKSHEDGVDIDIDFSGYVNRNAEVAQTLIDFLNSPLGNRVSVMFVTYNKAFTSAIQSVTLANGVKASTKIQNIKGHADHFHIRVTPATPTQQGILYAKVPRRGGGKKGAIFTSQPTLTLFPNPVQIDKQLLSIRIPNSDKQTTIAEIIRTNGQLVKTFSVNSLSEEAVISWDGTDFSGNRVESGMYLIKVRTSKGESSVKKLLIYK